MSTSNTGPSKRLIICCDGTWKDSDGKPDCPSNVTRIARCLKTVGYDKVGKKDIPQIVYYQSGVGVEGGPWTSFVGGATGKGISENIREAYRFICNNYNYHDEIFLVGFSRGAFTARSISTLIRCVGLLTPRGLVHLYPIFKDWENQDVGHWKSPYPPWPGRPEGLVSGKDEYWKNYRSALLQHEFTRADIPIKACAVFDTVGSLGIPSIGLLPKFLKQHLSFVDTKVEYNIENAFQALALDERRRPFSPTIWEVPDGQENPKLLKQCWFPGVHSDIGGGYPDAELANITLAWMISQLDPLLDFDKSYLLHQQDLTRNYIKEKGGELRKWGLGLIHDSFSPQYYLTGETIRTPCDYRELEFPGFVWGYRFYRSNDRRLHNTKQLVHASVRVREGFKGPGYRDRGQYKCPALKGWEWNPPISETGEQSKGSWTKETGEKDESILIMQEDELGEVEKILMDNWTPRIYDDTKCLPPDPSATHRKSVTFPKDKAHSVTLDGKLVTANGQVVIVNEPMSAVEPATEPASAVDARPTTLRDSNILAEPSTIEGESSNAAEGRPITRRATSPKL